MIDAKLEVTNLITPFINSFKLINDEWKNLFEIGISDYLHSQTEKYYFTNTFIHRSEKVRFDDIYYPIKANYKALFTDFYDLNSIFENYKNVTLIGSAGSGKTTLIKYIFLHAIRTTKKIPVLIELRFLNDYDGDFERLISDKILNSKLKPSESTFLRALESGSFLFLLDGYDEIFSDKKQNLNRQIELFVDSYSKNNFFITTRPGSGIENFPRFHDFKVCGLADDDVDGFIEKLVSSNERKGRIMNIIKDPKNNSYREYLRNPLLLSMFILAFESHPEIPSRKSSFYRNVFDTLYSKHDGITKNSFPREKLTKFEREDFEKILSIFSYLTLIQGKYFFTEELLTDTLNRVLKSTGLKCSTGDLIYDLQTTISILILDGFEYHFPHRSMQEYFTAQFISNLPAEKKQKAYNNLSETTKLSNDHSFHLWNLCSELDRFSFLSYFIIPELQKIVDAISDKDDKEILANYAEIIDLTIFPSDLDEVENPQDHEGDFTIYRLHNFSSRLEDFCDAYDYNQFADFIQTSGMKEEFTEYIKTLEVGEEEEEEVYFDPAINDMLIKYKVIDVINEIQSKLIARINDFQNELDASKKSIDQLLDL